MLFLPASIAFADNVAGHYVLRGVMEVGSELLLRPGGDFEYMLAYGAADYHAKGTWRRDGDSVVLNTSGKEEPPFRLLRSAASKHLGIRVWVKAPNGQPVQHIGVRLQTADGVAEQRTTSEGDATFPEARAAKAAVLSVRVYQVEAGPFPLNPAHNDFYFEINGDAIMTVRFSDECLKINGKDLEMRFWDKDRAMMYRRE